MLSWMAPGIWPKGRGIPEIEDTIRQIIQTKLAREYAQKIGLDKRADYVSVVKNKENEVRVNTLYYNEIFGKAEPTEDEQRNFFESHRENYKLVERSQLARIETVNGNLAGKVAQMWRSGRSFEDVQAMAIREDRTVVSLARTFDVPRGQEPPLDSLVYSGKAGDIIGPVFIPGGSNPDGTARTERWVVAQIMEIKPERLMTYEEASSYVKEHAKNHAAEMALEKFLEEARQKHPVKIDTKALNAITFEMLNKTPGPSA
jgi:hypothetical protein